MPEFGRVEIIYNHIGDVAPRAMRNAAIETENTARDIETYAKIVVPVDTGNLRSSIQAEKLSDLMWQVAPHTDYAIFVEYGTLRMRAQPYMRPAAAKFEPIYIERMGHILDKT